MYIYILFWILMTIDAGTTGPKHYNIIKCMCSLGCTGVNNTHNPYYPTTLVDDCY